MTGFLESARFLDVPSVDPKYSGLTFGLHNVVMYACMGVSKSVQH